MTLNYTTSKQLLKNGASIRAHQYADGSFCKPHIGDCQVNAMAFNKLLKELKVGEVEDNAIGLPSVTLVLREA